MIAALKSCDYLDEKLRVIGWDELYGLPKSIRERAKKASDAAAAKRKTGPERPEEQTGSEGGERMDGHRDGLPRGDRDGQTLVLTPAQRDEVRKRFGYEYDETRIDAELREFNERRAYFGDDDRSYTAFCGYLKRPNRRGEEPMMK